MHYVGIGPPWDVAVPPGAQVVRVPTKPSLGNVSQARARHGARRRTHRGAEQSAGRPHAPSDRDQSRRDPGQSIRYDLPRASVTLIYADGTGRSRPWFSRSVAADPPHIPGNPLPFGQKGSGVIHYAWYAGGWGIDGYAFEKAGQRFFLTAEPGTDLTVETIERTVGLEAGVSPVRT